MSKMGISTVASYTGAQVFEAIGLDQKLVDRVLHRHRPRSSAASGSTCSRPRSRRGTASPTRATRRRPRTARCEVGGEYQWRREGELHLFNPETVFRLQHATRARRYDVFKQYTRCRRRAGRAADDAARAVRLQGRRASAGADRRGRAGRPRSCKRFSTGAMSYGSISQEAHENARDRDEPPRREVQHRRGRRGHRPVRARRERRPAALGHQAGRERPVRRDERVPRQRRRPADQDGAGREARRGRPAARQQGLPVDRADAALDAGRRPDLAAAAPRHLLDRGPRAAHPRPQERQQPGARARQARRPRSASARSPPV